MSANKAKNTSPELLLRKELWRQGKRGYRLHVRIEGTRPDIVYSKRKLAIFVNGCYWHRCPNCKLPLPKSNVPFWKEKFRKNKARDKKKILQLKQAGWDTVTIWECEIKKNTKAQAERISLND